MDDDELAHLLDLQDGLIARRQALALGATASDVRRLLRRRAWTRVHPGVYVNHTGPLTWQQRAWAAVLHAEPAALCADSALRAADGPGRRERDDDSPLHVAVDRDRTFEPPDGVVRHRLADLQDKALWNARPPRLRIEEALIDVAAEAADDHAAIRVLSDGVQARRTTADRMVRALEGRSRIARREFLAGVLADIRDGTCSVLEHGYLTRVERPHGLPRAQRQRGASASGPIYRDVTHPEHGLVIELNGRLFHDNATSYDLDLDRDLDAAVDGLLTVRIGWGQVFRRPCATAERVGRLLQARGWAGEVTRCPRCDGGGSLPRGDTGPPLSA